MNIACVWVIHLFVSTNNLIRRSLIYSLISHISVIKNNEKENARNMDSELIGNDILGSNVMLMANVIIDIISRISSNVSLIVV